MKNQVKSCKIVRTPSKNQNCCEIEYQSNELLHKHVTLNVNLNEFNAWPLWKVESTFLLVRRSEHTALIFLKDFLTHFVHVAERVNCVFEKKNRKKKT